MASQPPEPPQTIVLGSFTGIRNTVSEERLKPNELVSAKNVDIDDAGQLRRRRGRTQVATGSWHSLRRIAGLHLGVRDGMLGTLNVAYQFTPILFVGPAPLCYTSVADVVYFASDTISGKLVAGTAQSWGHDGESEWISPVIRPTETLGAISGRMLTAPPRASEIEAYSGRIYLAAGRVLWATELYLYDYIDRTKNFITLEDDITMVRAVEDGLYVGTMSQLLFLKGTFAQGLALSRVMDCQVVQGSAVSVPYSKVHPGARQGPVPEGFGPVFMTAAGICLGLPNGQVYNLTQDRVVFPGMQRAAALYREDQGANSYVAVADSAGGPSANARIGDYVDAEIIRASQRG